LRIDLSCATSGVKARGSEAQIRRTTSLVSRRPPLAVDQDLAGLGDLERGHLRHPDGMPSSFERGRQPGVEDGLGVAWQEQARAQADDVGVVVGRDRRAASVFQGATARTPRSLLAAMLTPMPEPQTSTPRVPLSLRTARPTLAAQSG
jgi:hypothetical protein